MLQVGERYIEFRPVQVHSHSGAVRLAICERGFAKYMPLGPSLQPAFRGYWQYQAQPECAIIVQKQSRMHNNIAINKHRCAIVPETGLMRETLVRLLLLSSLPRVMLFLVKLFPEITVKSRPVRKRLVRLCRKT